MVCTIPANAWTWLVRPRKASVVTMKGAGLDAGEGNPGLVEGGPCARVRPRLVRDGVGARLDGWIPRTPSRGLAAGVVELGSGGGTSGAYIVGIVDHSYLAT
ncbi:hypothetical protein BHE74_00012692 [Ensete ventricosum]|nr:hypothetical protein BHE74_00012692 [Ensete ventricosum]